MFESPDSLLDVSGIPVEIRDEAALATLADQSKNLAIGLQLTPAPKVTLRSTSELRSQKTILEKVGSDLPAITAALIDGRSRMSTATILAEGFAKGLGYIQSQAFAKALVDRVKNDLLTSEEFKNSVISIVGAEISGSDKRKASDDASSQPSKVRKLRAADKEVCVTHSFTPFLTGSVGTHSLCRTSPLAQGLLPTEGWTFREFFPVAVAGPIHGWKRDDREKWRAATRSVATAVGCQGSEPVS